MNKTWVNYIFYKSYKPVTVLLIIIFLNYFGIWPVNLFMKLFSGMDEIPQLIASAVLTLILIVALFVALYLASLRLLRPRIFKTIPVKPGSKVQTDMVPTGPEMVMDNNAKSSVCSCAVGSSRELMGNMRFFLSDGEETIISINTMKREDGTGILRADCKYADRVTTCAFRINYCPRCGGRFVSAQGKVDESRQKTIP